MISQDYVESVCEVKTLKNILLVTGRIKKIDLESVEIYDPPHDMPLIALDTQVKITVYHREFGMQVLAGEVYLSNRAFMSVVHVMNFIDFEKRRYFRLDISHSAILLVPTAREPGEMEGKKKKEPLPAPTAAGSKTALDLPKPEEAAYREIPVRVSNISLCGLLFETGEALGELDGLKLRIALYRNKEEVLPVKVKRTQTLENGARSYGVEFMDMTEKQDQNLCAYLFREQQEQIRKNRERRDAQNGR